MDEKECNIKQKWVKGQDNPLIPNTHPHLLNSLLKTQSLFYHHLNLKRPTNLGKPKRNTKISQSSGPIHLLADETVYKEWEDKMKRLAITASSLEVEQDSEAQTRFEDASKQSNDPPLSRVNTLRSGDDSLKLKELMELCTKLSDIIQALVDKKKVIITKTSIRSDLKLDDAEGTDCLPTATIFAELERMGAKTTAWNEFSSTMASAIICLATNKNFNFSKYIFDNMVKNLEGGVKFLMYPRFVQVFLDKQVEGMSRHKRIYVISSYTKKVFANMKRSGQAAPTDSHSTPIITQPSSSKPQKKKSSRKQRKDSAPTEPTTEETTHEEHVSTPSYDPPQSGEDRMQLTELMNLCAQLQSRVLDLERAKTTQAQEITSLKKRVKQLEKRRKSRTSGLRRLRKVGFSSRVESSNDASLGAQEDASKQGRKIEDLDADVEVTLVNETQEINDSRNYLCQFYLRLYQVNDLICQVYILISSIPCTLSI
ncbi:hypothetical protein Tco_1146275 [Tanacetum coccineum]